MSYNQGGYFGVKDIWEGKNDAIKPQSGFWNKVDAIGVFFMRFEVILWIISIVISIIALFMANDNKKEKTKSDTESDTESDTKKE